MSQDGPSSGPTAGPLAETLEIEVDDIPDSNVPIWFAWSVDKHYPAPDRLALLEKILAQVAPQETTPREFGPEPVPTSARPEPITTKQKKKASRKHRAGTPIPLGMFLRREISNLRDYIARNPEVATVAEDVDMDLADPIATDEFEDGTQPSIATVPTSTPVAGEILSGLSEVINTASDIDFPESLEPESLAGAETLRSAGHDESLDPAKLAAADNLVPSSESQATAFGESLQPAEVLVLETQESMLAESLQSTESVVGHHDTVMADIDTNLREPGLFHRITGLFGTGRPKRTLGAAESEVDIVDDALPSPKRARF